MTYSQPTQSPTFEWGSALTALNYSLSKYIGYK
jgi:hypothetical protein